MGAFTKKLDEELFFLDGLHLHRPFGGGLLSC